MAMEFVVYGKFVYDKRLTQKEEVTIETLAGIKILKLNVKEAKVESVSVDMGEPILIPEKIPVILEEEKLNLRILDKEFEFTNVSMGNPHTVTFISDIKDFKIEKYGPMIEEDKHFPNRVNVEFAQIIDKEHVKMRVWERGSGETLACGTGACATLVASYLNGYTNRKAEIELLGGSLQIQWNEKDNHVYMTGPAITVFEGEL